MNKEKIQKNAQNNTQKNLTISPPIWYLLSVAMRSNGNRRAEIRTRKISKKGEEMYQHRFVVDKKISFAEVADMARVLSCGQVNCYPQTRILFFVGEGNHEALVEIVEKALGVSINPAPLRPSRGYHR